MVVFPIQACVVVHFENGDDMSILYVVFNALILCLGLGLGRLGSVLRERRAPMLAHRANQAES